MMGKDPLIDTLAGNYRLVERLGSGGMGDVYKGVHATIGSRVAIKVLHATAARDPDGERRFLREAQAVNRIDHDGVVKVIDAGRLDNGRPFLVMELLDGVSLAERQHQARPSQLRLPIRDACAIAIDVLDAVAAAHAAGVIHRDLKPPNIFLTRAGRTVVLDFGVAKLLAADAPVRLTITGAAIGTPHYMAPEQIQDKDVGPAADVYAIGVVLFELLCGRLPFDGSDPLDVMKGHLERRPPPPRALRADVPHAVQDAVLTAMAKDPAKRFASAAAMRDALRAALAGAEPAPPSPSPPRKRSIAPIVAIAIVAAALAAVVAWRLVRDPDDASIVGDAPIAVAVPTDAATAEPATCAAIGAMLDVGGIDGTLRREVEGLLATMSRLCADDAWPAKAVACYAAARDTAAMGMCHVELSTAKLDRLEREVMAQLERRISAMIADASPAPPDAATRSRADASKPNPYVATDDIHSRARAAYREAEVAYNLGDHERALAAYKRSYALSPEPDALFGIAQVYRRDDDCRQAVFFYKRFLATYGASTGARVELANQHIADCEKKLAGATVPNISITSEPTGAVADIAGVGKRLTPWSGTLPPGTYIVTLSKSGYEPVTQTIELHDTRLFVLQVALVQSAADPF